MSCKTPLSAVCSPRKCRAKLRCAAPGWAMKSGTLCGTCKADGSAGIQKFGVNTVQYASTINSSARTLTRCSQSLKTMMPRLTATEREWALENWRLETLQIGQPILLTFILPPSLTFVICSRPLERPGWRGGGTHRLLGMKSSTKVQRNNFLMIENGRTLGPDYSSQNRWNSVQIYLWQWHMTLCH